MAIIKFGMMMTDARGKLGGQVFTKTRSGAVVRTKVTPVNPQSVAQTLARTRLAGSSTNWRSLTEEQRLGWIALAFNITYTNIFGDSYKPTGKNLFVGVNANLALVNLPTLSVAPPVVAPGSILSVTTLFDLTQSEFIIEPILENAPNTSYLVYKATAPSSPGKYNFSGQYIVIATGLANAILSPTDLYNAYVSRFGVPPRNTKIGVAVSLISESGTASPDSQTAGVVENL